MLFDLITIAKVSIIFIYPNKILLFIENLCFCSLKISGASKNFRLKITIESKNCRLKIPIGRKKIKIPASLKISVRPKNLYLKISVQWCSGAICPESCKGIQGEPERMQEHTTTTRPPQESHKGRATKKFFCIYIGIIAQNQKYLKKS